MRPGPPAALQPLPPQYEAGGASLPSLDLSSNLETANRSWSVYQKEGLRTELRPQTCPRDGPKSAFEV